VVAYALSAPASAVPAAEITIANRCTMLGEMCRY